MNRTNEHLHQTLAQTNQNNCFRHWLSNRTMYRARTGYRLAKRRANRAVAARQLLRRLGSQPHQNLMGRAAGTCHNYSDWLHLGPSLTDSGSPKLALCTTGTRWTCWIRRKEITKIHAFRPCETCLLIGVRSHFSCNRKRSAEIGCG